MYLGKKDAGTIRYALYLAIQWEESVIEAQVHMTDEVTKKYIEGWKQNIKRFREISGKLLKGM